MGEYVDVRNAKTVVKTWNRDIRAISKIYAKMAGTVQQLKSADYNNPDSGHLKTFQKTIKELLKYLTIASKERTSLNHEGKILHELHQLPNPVNMQNHFWEAILDEIRALYDSLVRGESARRASRLEHDEYINQLQGITHIQTRIAEELKVDWKDRVMFPGGTPISDVVPASNTGVTVDGSAREADPPVQPGN